MAEERNTDPKMATSQPRENNGDGRKVFLHNLDDTETYGVHFGVNLHQKDGRFVFKDFLEGGMAYKTGFRSGDVLVSANSIDIDNVDLMQLLKELLDYKEFNYIIGVERKLDDGENTKFIWKIFKIFPKDSVLDVAVLETLENDSNEMPHAMLFPSTPIYDFIRASTDTYNIYIGGDKGPPRYLTVRNRQLIFQNYNENSKFFQYSYTDPGTGTCGNVVAYSLDDSFRRDVQSSPATFKNLKRMTVLECILELGLMTRRYSKGLQRRS
ncbi:uncharacterized protein LOC117295996 isoform X2 [Asterias rubens]|uniref:uncharacterized protein LOC117295996 isoform X2 n=1 Tax=Asterias rubens TaxID=7604 RepID=UPI0014554734|nr:uncharacterized protein LOC117295996 isoform X2 [Asterias rubens]